MSPNLKYREVDEGKTRGERVGGGGRKRERGEKRGRSCGTNRQECEMANTVSEKMLFERR